MQAGLFVFRIVSMTLVKSPVGKYVDVDEKRAKELIDNGFVVVTPEEEEQYKIERLAMFNKYHSPSAVLNADEVYFSTVSPGGNDGYGTASTKVLNNLQKLGVKVSTTYNGQKVAILFHNPYGLPRIESPYRIIYTMFESDKIPNDWIDYLKAADEVWVPSNWCRDVFANAGIKAEVVPLGYDDDTFKYIDRTPAEETHRSFTFLHYNAFNIRKGFTEVFKAFNKAFEKTEPVKMIFKTTLNTPPIPIVQSEYPNIQVVCNKLSQQELQRLCGSADCFVFPSRGEGFGITPLEAMATGLPAIIPNAHGIAHYFNEDFMYEAKVGEKCPGIYSRYKGVDVGDMVVCDVDDLVEKMRWVYRHQKEALEKGKKASEYVKQWTFAKTAEEIKRRLDIINSKPIEPKRHSNVLTLEQVR